MNVTQMKLMMVRTASSASMTAKHAITREVNRSVTPVTQACSLIMQKTIVLTQMRLKIMITGIFMEMKMLIHSVMSIFGKVCIMTHTILPVMTSTMIVSSRSDAMIVTMATTYMRDSVITMDVQQELMMIRAIVIHVLRTTACYVLIITVNCVKRAGIFKEQTVFNHAMTDNTLMMVSYVLAVILVPLAMEMTINACLMYMLLILELVKARPMLLELTSVMFTVFTFKMLSSLDSRMVITTLKRSLMKYILHSTPQSYSNVSKIEEETYLILIQDDMTSTEISYLTLLTNALLSLLMEFHMIFMSSMTLLSDD